MLSGPVVEQELRATASTRRRPFEDNFDRLLTATGLTVT